MNKTSLASSQKPSATPLNAKSAWARGPPQQAQASSTPPVQSSRGQSPNGTPSSTPSHSRKSSNFAPAVTVKDGVSMSRNIGGASHRSTPSLNFGTIDATASTPAPSAASGTTPPVNGSAATPPPAKDAAVHAPKTFGSVLNTAVSSTSSTTTSATPAGTASPTPSNTSAATSSAAAPAKKKLDPNFFFQKQPAQSSSSPSLASASPAVPSPSIPPLSHPNVNPNTMAPNVGVNSPSQRYTNLPQSSPYFSPQQPPQQVHQHLRPTGQAGGAPRSPSFGRGGMPLNGTTPGPNGSLPNGISGPGRGPQGGPSQQSQPGQVGSPRLGGQPGLPPPHPPQQQTPGPQPPHIPGQPPYTPTMQPQGWQQPPYGWYPPPYPEQWYPNVPHMQYHHPHHPQSQYMPPPTPMQPYMPGTPQTQPAMPPNGGLPQSPRTGPITPLPQQSTGSAIPATTPINTNVPPLPQTPQGPPSSLNTPLTAGARPFVPSSLGTSSPMTPSMPFPQKRTSAVRITNPNSGEAVVLRPPDAGHVRTLSREVESRKLRLESEEDRKRRLAEAEAKERKVKEEAEAAIKAEEERIRKEKEAEEAKKRADEEERQRKEDEARRKKEEEERLQREEEERKQREEAERLQKLEEERLKKEEEERLQKEEEERRVREEERIKREEEERIQREREEAEAKAKAEAELKAEQERLQKEAEVAEAEAKAKAREEAEAKEKSALQTPASSASVSAAASPKPAPSSLPSKPTLPPISTNSDRRRPVPGPIDISAATKGIVPSLPSALATARKIDDLDSVSYPEGIKTPSVELNQGATKGGKYKYDRDFLLQFMTLCKEKPDNLPPLQDLGIEKDGEGTPSFGSTGRSQGRRGMGSMGPPSSTRSTSGALGLNGMPFGPSSKANPFAMGQFGSLGRMTSDERFAASSPRVASTGSTFVPGRPTPMSRSSSQGGVGGVGAGGVPPSPREANRTRSQRGRQRNDSLKPTPAPPPQQHQMQNGFGFEPVLALQQTEGRWKPPVGRNKQQLDESSPEYVERKVKALLNKLTLEKFDSISNQIIEWANKSEKETNGQTLIHVIKLVFEKATDEATFSEMYARLCRKMMETISPNVQDESIRNNEGKPIVGGHLFRKYLLNRCQEDFERGWSAKESAQAAAALKAADDKAAAEAASKADDGEVVLYSEEYYAALKAKRQGLGLVKFIGELFKLQMLTERIMHECIKKLLSKIDNPEEEEIESLCKLLSTVGQSLDTQKAKGHMDIYFARMKTLRDNPNIVSRVRYMLLDVIELRERRWQVRQAVAAPQTIAQVHEQAAKERAAVEEATQNSRISMSRGGSKRGEQGRGEYGQPGADGWNVAGPTPMRAPAKAGDLSNFGKFTKTGPMMSMGPSSVFKKGDRGRDTPPPGGNPPSRAPSSGNMFNLLNSSEAPTEGLPQRTPSNRGTSRKASVDLNSAAPETPTTRKKLQLLPRTNSLTPADEKKPDDEHSETGTEPADAPPSMTDEQAKKKIEQDIKEFFAIRNLDEAEAYFDVLPEEHKSKLVDKLVGKALEAKEEDSQLVADLFSRAAGKSCSNAAFADGFSGSIEFLDDIAIDAPHAYSSMARMLRGSKLPQDAVESLAAKIYVDGNPVKHPKDKLLKLYAEMA